MSYISVITAAGGEVDAEKLAALISDLEGKDIHELLAKGDKDLKSVVGVAAASGIIFRVFYFYQLFKLFLR